MSLIISVSRYLLPILTVLILAKCVLALLLGHPKEKIYGCIVDTTDGQRHMLNMWETSIGRSASCDIAVSYGTVSRFHAVISRRIDGWYVYDLRSKAGIRLNGDPINKKATIKNGDILTMGEINYRFEVIDDPVQRVGKNTGKKAVKQQIPESRQTDYAAFSNQSQQNSQGDYYQPYGESYQSQSAPLSNTDYIQGSSKSFANQNGNYPSHSYAKAIVNPNTGEIFALCGNLVTIGRSYTCDIKLNSPSVSRHHADLVLYEDGWAVVDAGSKSGTFLNGEKINGPQLLFSGDTIGLSDEKLTVT